MILIASRGLSDMMINSRHDDLKRLYKLVDFIFTRYFALSVFVDYFQMKALTVSMH